MRKTTMLKTTVGALAATALVLVTGPTARAQNYSNTVVGLNPVGYWPLNETVAPPQPLNLTAANLGTLGAAGNGYYGAWYAPSGNQWYLTNNILQAPAVTAPYDGSVGMLCNGGPGQYVILPRNTNGVVNPGVALNPPFSIEAWVQIGTTASALGDIVSQGGTVNLNTGGPNTNNPYYGGLGTGWAGVELGQYQDYIFLLTQATNASGNKSSELDTSTYNTFTGFKVGQWVHVVATFDGTTEAIWTNGILCASKTSPANAIGQRYVTDPTTPLMIGAGSDVTADYGINFKGTIDDVAIYNEVLPQSSIINHYQAAYGNFTTFSSYTNAVLADSPVIYYRLNDPQTQVNAGYPSGTFPVANNYGSAGAAGNGVYQPGTTPGVAGPAYAGFGANSKAVALNGWLGSVDVGGGSLPASLNPVGTVPMTVVTWFQSGPADAPGRFQEMLGHGNSSYRLAMGQVAGENHFNPGPGPELQFTSPQDVASNGFAFNDGNWHMAAGVSDGTNEYLYLDGVLAKSASSATGINIAGNAADLLIGGDSEYTYASPTSVNTVRTFDGQVAQVAFWTNALNAQQIQSLFAAAGVPPYIWQEPPATEAISAGQNLTVPVGVRGSAVTFQWYRNGSPVSGQTASSLSYTPVGTANAGSYFLVAKNSSGSVTSSVVTLTVYGPPTVEVQTPTQLDIFAGSSPTLNVTALGATPIQYQWTLNGSAISGATNASYTVPDLQASGTYGCLMTNFVGHGAITPIAITLLADPTAPYPTKVLADQPIAYFRLDETSGTTAYDYVGGDNGTYTNVELGVPGYNSVSDPNETAAEFGAINPPNDYAGNVPPYLNFGTPSGGNAEFSVEAWITEYEYVNGNGIVALGYGNGGEQFVLDTGDNTQGDLRFFVRNAAGTVSTAGSTDFLEDDGLWHHVVGVCDEAGGNVYLYLDGNLVSSGAITPGSGLLSSTVPLSIGARQSGNNGNTNYDFQFYGSIDDVAVYNKPLTASQVLAHYEQSGIAPLITGLQPSSTWTTNQDANVTVTVNVEGTSPLAYQWLDNNGNVIPWATGASITLTNVQPSAVGNYTVNVTNLYGGPVSTNFTLNVTQVPEIISDITPSNETVYASEPVTLSVTVAGTPPLHYQWYQNGTAIPGATNTTYTFAALLGSNSYYLAVTNIYSAGTPTLSSTATVVGMPATTLNPADYTDNMKITFAGYNRGETLSDFPALVRLSTTNVTGFNYNHFASPTGGDLRFTDAGGTIVIPSEINQWNPAGESTVWVQVPALSGTNTTIWAYWGNPSDTTPPPGTNVWVPPSWQGLPAYEVVYHLEESNFPYADATGQYPSTTGVAPTPIAGLVGNGQMFNNAAYLDAGTVNLGETFTLSAWVNVSSAIANIQSIWANGPGGYSSAEVVFFVNDYNTGDGVLELGTGNGSAGTQFSTAQGAVSFGQWHFVTATLDRGAGTAELYVDGVLGATGPIRTDFPTNADTQLARFTGGAFALDGDMDEARIHEGVDSSNWVWACYQTVQQTASLETYSTVSSTVTNLPTPVKIAFKFTAGNLVLSGSGGPAGGTYYVIGSTNLTTPVTAWQVLSTDTFDSNGDFNVSIPVDVAKPEEFLQIKE